jgi:hypothetical protein
LSELRNIYIRQFITVVVVALLDHELVKTYTIPAAFPATQKLVAVHDREVTASEGSSTVLLVLQPEFE